MRDIKFRAWDKINWAIEFLKGYGYETNKV